MESSATKMAEILLARNLTALSSEVSVEGMELIFGDNEDEVQQQQQQQEVEIARGGPIYATNFVGPLIKVPRFRSAVLDQLQALEAQLCFDSSQPSINDQDVSLDDLKIITDEDLVHMGLKETFKDQDSLQMSSQLSNEKSKARSCTSRESTKRRKRSTNHVGEGDYIEEVKEIAKIKQKQDEDKGAVKLHSLNANCKTTKGDPPSSDAIQRMKSLRSINSIRKSGSSLTTQEHRAVLYPEVVLCVEVYHTKRKWVKTQELLVLGSQTLTELRDKIYCLTDHVMQKAGQHDSSGYFLIENAFYNDFRDPSAVDYSEPLRDWLRNSKDEALKKWEWINLGELQRKQKAVVGDVTSSDLPSFGTFEMRRKFCDLNFRLGAGYLYCHQGACEHVIVIRDMRMIHPEDAQNPTAYPMVIFQLKVFIQKCHVCRIYRAKKVTVDDKWSPENPCYLCDYCFLLLHSQDGQPYIEYVHD